MKNLVLVLLLLAGAAGTNAQAPALVEDIWKGSTGSTPGPYMSYNGALIFYALDSLHGRELWKWSGSAAMMIANTRPGTIGAGDAVAVNADMAVLNGKLYCAGSIGSGQTIMIYDGVNPPAPAPGCAAFTSMRSHWLNSFGGKLYFIGDTGAAKSPCLFSYDGTNPPVLHKFVGMRAAANNEHQHMAYFGGKVIFEADSDGVGPELFVLDPLTKQCGMLADIWAGPQGSLASQFIVAGSKLYFVASVGSGLQLYSYDGTAIVKVTSPFSGFLYAGQFNEAQMASYRGAIFFKGHVSSNHTALFKYDTATGITTLVKDVHPGSDATIYQLTATPNNLYFGGKTAAAGTELWKYDGSVCAMVADLNPGTTTGLWPATMVAFQGGLYFTGNNGITGNELYRVLDLPGSSGIQSARWEAEVSLYPNPVISSAILSIGLQSNQSLHIALTDLNGREVFNTGVLLFASGKNEVVLPMKGLAAGQYFYRIIGSDGGALASGTVIKQ